MNCYLKEKNLNGENIQMKKYLKKRGQVWMETLLYTVVTLSILTMVLSFALPKLQQGQERAVIASHVTSLKMIDKIILDLSSVSAGNQKKYILPLEEGTFTVDGVANTISITIPDVGVKYTEPDIPVSDGRVTILTTKTGKKEYLVVASTSYTNFGINITAKNRDEIFELTKAPTPYEIVIRKGQSIKEITENGVPKKVSEYFISIDNELQ